jgi:hypothetical protein
MPKIEKLREKHRQFIYKRYGWDISSKGLEIFFDFQISPDINFRPTVLIEKVAKEDLVKAGDDILNNLVFNLGMAEIASYWKTTCSPEIIIEAGALSPEQKKWWRWLLMNGLGQFFYENKIDPCGPDFLRIKNPAENKKIPAAKKNIKLNDKILVPIGGGKDSAVTLEILAQNKKDILCFCLNPSEESLAIAKTAGNYDCAIAKRTMDKKLIELNRQGYLNGHTPFSAYLAFLTTLAAALFDCQQIAVSNEASSNEATLKYLGKDINHQWSKTFAFERSFRKYSQKYLSAGTDYFSFLRPLHEIQIAKIFSGFEKYHPLFISCNEAYKTRSGQTTPTGKWCASCSKCLFAFIILYPFISEEKMIKIFGQNLFENKALLETAKELTGEKPAKPLECVGTREESRVSFYLSLLKFRRESPSSKLPFLLDHFEKKAMPKNKNWSKGAKKILASWNEQNSLPEGFDKILKRYFL